MLNPGLRVLSTQGFNQRLPLFALSAPRKPASSQDVGHSSNDLPFDPDACLRVFVERFGQFSHARLNFANRCARQLLREQQHVPTIAADAEPSVAEVAAPVTDADNRDAFASSIAARGFCAGGDQAHELRARSSIERQDRRRTRLEALRHPFDEAEHGQFRGSNRLAGRVPAVVLPSARRFASANAAILPT